MSEYDKLYNILPSATKKKLTAILKECVKTAIAYKKAALSKHGRVTRGNKEPIEKLEKEIRELQEQGAGHALAKDTAFKAW